MEDILPKPYCLCLPSILTLGPRTARLRNSMGVLTMRSLLRRLSQSNQGYFERARRSTFPIKAFGKKNYLSESSVVRCNPWSHLCLWRRGRNGAECRRPKVLHCASHVFPPQILAIDLFHFLTFTRQELWTCEDSKAPGQENDTLCTVCSWAHTCHFSWDMLGCGPNGGSFGG